MDIKNIFIVLSTVLTLCAAIPYILDILRKKTRPRIVSWFNWALLGFIAAMASLSDHQYAAAIMSFTATVECLLIVILGWHRGDKQLVAFDVACQLAALVGLLLWWIFNSPAIAIIAAITIDLVASLPTLRHAWRKPLEETWMLFLMSGLGATFTIFAAREVRITSLANPIYIALINYVFVSLILFRRRAILIS